MSTTYSPESSAVLPGSIGDFVAGARCPDFVLRNVDAVDIRFYELVSYGKFVILKPSSTSFDVWKISKQGEIFDVKTPVYAKLTSSFDLGQDLKESIGIRPDLYTGYIEPDVVKYFQGFVL